MSIEEKLKILSQKESNIMIFSGKLIGHFYTKEFYFQKIDDYWEITLDNEIDTIYLDDDVIADIDTNGLICIYL